MKSALPPCPSCHSEKVVKNGRSRHGKQSYRCRGCGRQFVLDPQWQLISEEMKGMIDRLLLEKISRRRNCSCVTNFRTVGAKIRQSEV